MPLHARAPIAAPARPPQNCCSHLPHLQPASPRLCRVTHTHTHTHSTVRQQQGQGGARGGQQHPSVPASTATTTAAAAHSSLRWPVTLSSELRGAGPMASTVRDPGATCVRPVFVRVGGSPRVCAGKGRAQAPTSPLGAECTTPPPTAPPTTPSHPRPARCRWAAPCPAPPPATGAAQRWRQPAGKSWAARSRPMRPALQAPPAHWKAAPHPPLRHAHTGRLRGVTGWGAGLRQGVPAATAMRLSARQQAAARVSSHTYLALAHLQLGIHHLRAEVAGGGSVG